MSLSNLDQECFLSAGDISLALAKFWQELNDEDLCQLRLHGGHIWFTWRWVKPADLSLNLHIGDPNDRMHTEWLDYGDVHIPLEADQDIEYDTDGNPDLDPLVTAQRRAEFGALSAMQAEEAFMSIEHRIAIQDSQSV